MRLQGKVALVTGASRGIGRAIAKLFIQEGAKIAVNYNLSETEALRLSGEVKDQSPDVFLVKADVSKLSEVKMMVEKTVKRFSRIDVLVNNAGIIIPTNFPDTAEEVWDRTMEVNLKGVYLCCKEVAPIMLKLGKGKIINISSISGLAEKSAISNVPYSVSKAGVIGLTRSLAVNLSPEIRVNAICPGIIDTDMAARLTSEKKRMKIEHSLIKRIGKPEEIAYAAVFLASDESDYITGEIITVAGGRAMR